MIEAKNVVKSFDGFRALDGLTMTVPHGSIYGLVGPNGAGKSTLLRHVTGVYRQDSGSSSTRMSGRQHRASQKADCFCMPLESRRMGCFSGMVVNTSFRAS